MSKIDETEGEADLFAEKYEEPDSTVPATASPDEARPAEMPGEAGESRPGRKPVYSGGEEEEYAGGLTEEEEMEADEPLPPPPPEEEKELLFLIEFLVDTLTLFPENMAIENIDPCALQGPTSVALTFLHFPPMLISEKDIDADKLTGSNEVKFNSGKSLMFALTESQFEEPPPVFLIVKATKDMPHAFRFPQMLIGKTKIQLSELFKQVFDKYDENPGKTVSKSIKDKYELLGEKNKPAGEVSIYIRLTCIGENIETEFLKGEDAGEPLLFKNKESKKVYECKPTERPDDSKGMAISGWGNKATCEEGGGKSSPPDPDDENFEEIFAGINCSTIRVKVEKSDRKEVPREFHISEFCDCAIPLPQNLVAGMSDLSLSPASEGSMNFGDGTPIQTEKRVGLCGGNQLMFQVPPADALAQPGLANSINYSVKTCNKGEGHGHKGKGSFRVMTNKEPDASDPKLPNDPDKDVLIFRIIKKGKKDKGKECLTLEFKVPKEKIALPPKPPYMVDAGAGPEKQKKDKKKKKK